MIVGQRQPREECPAFLAFVRRRPCVACGAPPPSQAAHVRYSDAARGHVNPGVGAKSDDRRCVPLCADCHLDAPDSQHRTGDERKFWARVGTDPDEVAARLWAQFCRREKRSPEQRATVVKRAVRKKRSAVRKVPMARLFRPAKSRPIRSANRWPLKGSRKIGGKS